MSDKSSPKNKSHLHVRPAPENSFLRALRVLRGWSQATLAIRVGVSQDTVSKIERRSRVASAGLRNRFAAALSVEVSDIFPDETAAAASVSETARARRG